MFEMGEFIYKFVICGVFFWVEMDQKIFSFFKEKCFVEFKKQKGYIIKKFNEDFYKVWFGQKKDGIVVDFEDMIYGEVVCCMVVFFYVEDEKCWIDLFYVKFMGDFIYCFEECFIIFVGQLFYLQSYVDLDEFFVVVECILLYYFDVEIQFINV